MTASASARCTKPQTSRAAVPVEAAVPVAAAVAVGDAPVVPVGEPKAVAVLVDEGVTEAEGELRGTAALAVAVADGEAPDKPLFVHAVTRRRVAIVVDAINEFLMRYTEGNQHATRERHIRCTGVISDVT
jgi:hypothetical protein